MSRTRASAAQIRGSDKKMNQPIENDVNVVKARTDKMRANAVKK